MLNIYVHHIELGLLREFSHTPKILREHWAPSLVELETASSGWVHWCNDALPQDNETLSHFSVLLSKAIQVLQKEPAEGFTFVSLTYEALSHVSKARRDLVNLNHGWKQQMQLPADLAANALTYLPRNHFPTQEEVSGNLAEAQAEFRDAIVGADDFKRCRSSRRLCHSLLYLLTLHPSAWTPELHADIVWLLRRAWEQMEPDKLRQALQNRLDFVLSLSPPPHVDLRPYFERACHQGGTPTNV